MSTRKKADEIAEDVAPEYDFRAMGKPVRGKYYARVRRGTNVVVLDPDVSAAFPTGDAVNDALRSLLEKSGKASSRKRPTSSRLGARSRS